MRRARRSRSTTRSRARSSRGADYLAARSRFQAAQASERAATSEWLPTLHLDADFGTIGQTVETAHPTYTVGATVKMNVFDGGRTKARRIETLTALRQREAELADFKGRVEYDVRTALLDLRAADQQMQAAQTSVQLAADELQQARDRFAAGVASNLEVTQAQESVAARPKTYISALYATTWPKPRWRARIGIAESAVMNYLGGRSVMAEEKPSSPRGAGRWLVIAVAVVVRVLVAGIVWLRARGRESTDDAQIDGHITQISARVGGPVLEGERHQQPGGQGRDVLVRIDPREYQVAVERAKAELADAQANAAAARTGVPIARVETRRCEHGVAAACRRRRRRWPAPSSRSRPRAPISSPLRRVCARREATADEGGARRRAACAARRRRKRSRSSSSTRRSPQADAARAAADAAKSDVAAAQAAIAVAEQRAAAGARRGGRRPVPACHRADRARSSCRSPRRRPPPPRRACSRRRPRSRRRNSISSTPPQGADRRRRQPQDGRSSDRSIQAGQPLMALVDLDDVWVTANFKETQLKSMRPGQAATVEVDALGGREFQRARRQHRRRDRREVQPAAARERDRQLRQGRAARPGEDRPRAGPGSRSPLRPGMSVGADGRLREARASMTP